MKKILMCSLFALLTFNVNAKSDIPQWFVNDLKNNVGNWITDNSTYQSDKESQESYGMQWQWGIGQTSITGKLYGFIDGKKTQDYWHFRQYWDNQQQKAMLVQYGSGGVIGVGVIKQYENDETQTIQEFSLPDGRKWSTKHISQNSGTVLNTQSLNLDKDGEWQDDRNYIWNQINDPIQSINKENTTMKANTENNLGTFSISLSVKDIAQSYEFYKKLGFEKLDGNIDQNWLILKNGKTKIGLFQGMFPKNTITFNPKDAREIHQELIKYKDVEIGYSSGLDKETGPVSFSITDPDGNPILIDQH